MQYEEDKAKQLPTLAELISDKDMVVKQNSLNILLNEKPPAEWLQDHPTAKGPDDKPIKYIPIERIEWLLFRIFVKWNLEIRDTKIIANSVLVTVRLHYRNPITNEMEWQDGIGAMPMQTNKGAGASDWNQIKSAAVQMAAPAAESFALKDAAEKLGRMFGKDINRKDQMAYRSMNADTFNQAEKIQLKKKISEAMGFCQDQEIVGTIMDELIEAEENGTDTIAFLNEQLAKLQKDGSN